jgi:cobalt/nickel transport system permease protein
MKHSFVDEFSGLDSFVHRLDPRTKLLGSLAFVLTVVLTAPDNWRLYGVYLCVLAGLLLLSRLPLLHVLKRSLVIFPFVIMVAVFTPFVRQGQVAASCDIGTWHIAVTYEGLAVLVNTAVKSWLCILCLIILSSSTKFERLLQGMYWLKVPRILVQVTSFMYRYMFVIADQAMRMQMSRDSRNFGMNRRNIFRTMGNMVGTLFIRSYERAERIYAAMLSRGYNGEISGLNTLRFNLPDAYFLLTLSVLLVCPAILWW